MTTTTACGMWGNWAACVANFCRPTSTRVRNRVCRTGSTLATYQSAVCSTLQRWAAWRAWGNWYGWTSCGIGNSVRNRVRYQYRTCFRGNTALRLYGTQVYRLSRQSVACPSGCGNWNNWNACFSSTCTSVGVRARNRICPATLIFSSRSQTSVCVSTGQWGNWGAFGLWNAWSACNNNNIRFSYSLARRSCTGSTPALNSNRLRSRTLRCPPRPSPNCFPRKASVTTTRGKVQIEELQVGDRVLTVNDDGQTAYDDVYFFGHKESAGVSAYIQLKTGSDHSLILTGDHFLPVGNDWKNAKTIRAKDVKVGDNIWVMSDSHEATLQTVTSTDTIMEEGKYNPYTLNGRLVVDGVLASAHSHWILDDVWPAEYSHLLSHVYQWMFAPLRAIYRLSPSFAKAMDQLAPQGVDVGGDVSLSQFASMIWSAVKSA